LGAVVQRVRDGGFVCRQGCGLGYGVGQGCGDVKFFNAGDHLRGAAWFVGVVPDSYDNFETGV